MLGRILLSAVATATLATSLYASPMRQVVCPSVSAIQSKGVSMAMEIFPEYYLGIEKDSYNTSTNWLFAIGFFEAADDGEAIEAANDVLPHLSGPVQDDSEDETVCMYDTNDPNIAALALEDDGSLPYAKIKRLMIRHHK